MRLVALCDSPKSASRLDLALVAALGMGGNEGVTPSTLPFFVIGFKEWSKKETLGVPLTSWTACPARTPRPVAAAEPRNLPIPRFFCDTSPKNSALSLTGCNLLESRGPADQTFLPALGRRFLPGHVVRFGG